MTQKIIQIGGRDVTIVGNPQDRYFGDIVTFVEELRPLEAWIRQTLPPDAIVMDVGGNIGLTALLLTGLLPQGHVHVFEALPSNVEYLRQNIADNNITNCTVNAVAVGNCSARVAMRSAGAGSSVAVEGSFGFYGQGSIPMITLDSYMAEAGLNRLDFIKMDIEGFEPAALDGAAAMIESLRPSIFMEFNSWCLSGLHGFNLREFAFKLWDAFQVQSIDEHGLESPAAGGDVTSFQHDNLVLHRGVDDILLRLKPGARIPQMVVTEKLPPVEVTRLREQIAAVERSTSWRVTAPLRAIRRMFWSERLRAGQA